MKITISRTNAGRGFTLVEVVISIALVLLMIGIATVSMGSLAAERRLREVTSTVKDYAKKARAQALLEQRAFQIQFQPDFVSVQALQPVGDDEIALNSLFAVEGEAVRAQELRRYEIPGEFRIEILRWNRKEWIQARNQTWVFEQSGICEPLGVRVTGEDGYIEMQFNPLTANVEEEASEIQ